MTPNLETKPAFGNKKDVAIMLDCCVRTVDTLLKQGMPHIKYSARRVIFDMAAVDLWIRTTFQRSNQPKP